MLIKVVQENAEHFFLEALQESMSKATSRGVLRCALSSFNTAVSVQSMLALLKEVLHEKEGALFFCHDMDLLVMWRGELKETRDEIIALIKQHYRDKLKGVSDDDIFRFYDTLVHGEEIHVLVRDKINRLPKESEKPPAHEPKFEVVTATPKPSFTFDQLQILSSAIRIRKRRKHIEVLVVEDQDFSRKLLAGLIEKNWICHGARNAAEAMTSYATHAPDICFLDVELPDANGHDLAVLFTANDPECSIVMVTANHYVQDVTTAKQNKVAGFIVKPYNKQKIFHAIESLVFKKQSRRVL